MSRDLSHDLSPEQQKKKFAYGVYKCNHQKENLQKKIMIGELNMKLRSSKEGPKLYSDNNGHNYIIYSEGFYDLTFHSESSKGPRVLEKIDKWYEEANEKYLYFIDVLKFRNQVDQEVAEEKIAEDKKAAEEILINNKKTLNFISFGEVKKMILGDKEFCKKIVRNC